MVYRDGCGDGVGFNVVRVFVIYKSCKSVVGDGDVLLKFDV